jgi:hypothetical protein
VLLLVLMVMMVMITTTTVCLYSTISINPWPLLHHRMWITSQGVESILSITS